MKRSVRTCSSFRSLLVSSAQILPVGEKNITGIILLALATIFAVALLVLAPLPLLAAEFSDELGSDSRSNSALCSPEQSPLLIGCTTTEMDQAAKAGSLVKPVADNYQQGSGQIDATGLLEDLLKSDGGQDLYLKEANKI